MTRWTVAASGLVAIAGLLVTSPAPAGQGPILREQAAVPFVVTRFSTGPRASGFHRFLRVGGPGATEVRRDDFLRFSFSSAVDMDTLNERTVRIVADDDSSAPATDAWSFGTIMQDLEWRFDPVGDGFVPWRLHRRTALFDPVRIEWNLPNHTRTGFAADTSYSITLPGTDQGAVETVMSRDGRLLARTYHTRFHTGSAYNFFFADTPDYTDGAPPTVVSIEASDAPGVPLDGRMDVDSRSSIVVHFSGPILRDPFMPRRRIRHLYGIPGTSFRFIGRLSEDGMTCTFRPRRPLPPGISLVFYYPDATLFGRSGRFLPMLGPVTFQASAP